MGIVTITSGDDQLWFPRQVTAFENGLTTPVDPVLNSIWDALVLDMPNPEKVFKHRDFGWLSRWYEWKGQEHGDSMQRYDASDEVKEWHINWEIPKADLKFAAGPRIERKALQAGNGALLEPRLRLLETHIQADAVSTSTANKNRVVTNKAFFASAGSATEHFGDDANANNLTQDITATGAITAAEALILHKTTRSTFKGFKTDRGEFVRYPVSNVLYLMNEGHVPGFLEAFKAEIISQTSNVFTGGGTSFLPAQVMAVPDMPTTTLQAYNISPGVDKPYGFLHPEGEFIELGTDGPELVRHETVRGHAYWQLIFLNPFAAINYTLS